MSEINKLKSVSVSEMESVIAKALSELTGVEYDCSISNINFDAIEGAKLEVSVSWRLNSQLE